jgi:hypothetical protein
MSTLPPLTPEGIARSDAMADGRWRDAEGRNLIEAIVATLGNEAGGALWHQAVTLFEGRTASSPARRSARPKLYLVPHNRKESAS